MQLLNVNDREGNEITLIDVLGCGQDDLPEGLVQREEVEPLRQDLGILPAQERKVLELRFGLREHRRRTQRDLGIFRTYVSRIDKRAVSRLVKEFQAR